MPRLNGDLPWKNANKTCWASSSFRVFLMIQTNLSGVEWLGWFGPQKWSPSDVHQKSTSSLSSNLQHISHFKLRHITGSYNRGSLFLWWMLWIYSKREHSSYNSHAFLVGFLRPWAPANNLNSLGLLKLILPALGFFGDVRSHLLNHSVSAGREACKAPAEQTANKKSGAQVVHVLPSGWHQRHFQRCSE